MPTTILDKVIINAGEETASKPVLIYNPVTKRVYWQTSPIPRIEALEAKLDSENNFKFIPDPDNSFNPATRVLTMAAGWVGTINGVDYTNVASVPLPAIPLATIGYSRIDLIVFNTAGTFVIIAGTQSQFTPKKPTKPVNTLEATFVTVSDGDVTVPVTPKPKAPVTSVNGMRGDVIIPTASKATDTTAGIVKTDVTEVDPVVYTKETTDNLLDGKANYFLDIKNITGITYNVILTDILNELVYSGTLPMNVIIPNNTVVPFPIGTMFYTLGTSTGIITASGAAGVTLNVKAGISLSAIQNEVRQYTKIGTNTWSVRGDLNLGAVTQTELSYLQGLTSNIQAQINAKAALSGGIVNRLMKWASANTATVSKIVETATALGIGTVNIPSKDITLGNQNNREIGIEEDFATVSGKSLSLKAGRTNDFIISPSLAPLGLGLNLKSIVYMPNGDFYGITPNGNLYKRNSGTVIFNLVSSTGHTSNILYVDNNGILYLVTSYWGLSNVFTVNINTYVLTQVDAILAALDYLKASNGYTYIIKGGAFGGNPGEINKRLNNETTWNPVLSGKLIKSICEAPNGNIYAIEPYGDIYVQYSGIGDFIPLNQTYRLWSDIHAAPNGNIYATVGTDGYGSVGDIYIQYFGVGAFIPLNQTQRAWTSIAIDLSNNVYISTPTDVYYLDNSAKGTANLDGGSLKIAAGTGKGIGKSRYEVYTGQKTASGTDMQVETLREYIDENGYHVYTSMPVYADNAAALTGGLPVGCKYRNATGDLKIVY